MPTPQILMEFLYTINQSKSFLIYLRVFFLCWRQCSGSIPISLSSPSGMVCWITAPMSYTEAPHAKVSGRLGSKCAKTLPLVNRSLHFTNQTVLPQSISKLHFLSAVCTVVPTLFFVWHKSPILVKKSQKGLMFLNIGRSRSLLNCSHLVL